ncbi:MAG: four helix bundle protein [Opitutaceae bacterium]|nr:four helix bundle protein [Verrucomicrobiales bacterium]
MKIYFDHEKLQAYKSSLEFIRWSEPILEKLHKTAAVYSQLDRARTSVPLNIAEGNAKFTPPDKCKYFDTAHGSTVECAACLDLLFIKHVLSESELGEGKMLLSEIVGLLIGLIKSKLPDRFRDEAPEYRVNGGFDDGVGV